mgnify:CR=1 FL=1
MSESEVRDSALFKASPLHKLQPEQLEAKNKILTTMSVALSKDYREHQLIFVNGAAGTGKTVLNNSIFYEIIDSGEELFKRKVSCAMMVNHNQQMKVYSQLIRKLDLWSDPDEIIMKPTTFIHRYNPDNPIDIAFVDEAHLLLTQANQSYTGHNQLQDIIDRAKVTVVMFDENQILTTLQHWEADDLLEYRKLSKRQGNYIELTSQLRMLCSKETEKWIKYIKSQGFSGIFADLNKQSDIKNIVKAVEDLGSIKNEKYIAKGMKPQPVRAMIIGIPNVGKSTLINKISGRRAASVENKPGHTKSQQWIKVSNKFELLDTPGILPPSYEDAKDAINLALVGSISSNILPIEELAKIGFNFVKENYPEYLKKRFEYLDINANSDECFEIIAEKRGYLIKGGKDIDKAHKVFLNELKNGLIGEITFERI